MTMPDMLRDDPQTIAVLEQRLDALGKYIEDLTEEHRPEKELAANARRIHTYVAVITECRRMIENANYALNTPSIARGKEAHLTAEIERLKAREQGAWAALYAALGFPTIPPPTDS